MAQFFIANHAQPTTAAPSTVTTGTSIKTMLQVKPSATLAARIIQWGYRIENTAAILGKIELIEVDVAATVTAHVAAGIVKWDALALLGGDPTTNLIQVGTTATGYTSTGEGTVTAGRLLDGMDIELASTSLVFKKDIQFPLGREPILQVGLFARIRATFTTAVNMYCYMIVEV